MKVHKGISRVILSLLLISSSLSATTYYVSPNGSDNNGGLSWETAFATIQKGINSSINGDIVEVAEGAYYQKVNFNGKSITLTSTDPNNWDVVKATIVDAGGSGTTVTLGTNANSTLKGFTIQGSGSAAQGISCLGNISPTISRCIIKGNATRGIHCSGGGNTTKISDNIIKNNPLGIWCRLGAASVIKNNLIYNNGMAISTTMATSSLVIRNNTIVNNTYGINNLMGTQPIISNCIVWGCNVDLYNCNATYSCISDSNDIGNADTTYNICSDPCFVNSDTNDFHLGVGSPCINAGDMNLNDANGIDLDGKPQLSGGRIDIGCYEYQLFGMTIESVTGDANQVVVVTTGARYILNRTDMNMFRRVDPCNNQIDNQYENNGLGRQVASLDFNGTDIGPLNIESVSAGQAIVSSSAATFDFRSDSMFFIEAKVPFVYYHHNLIANAPWNQKDIDRNTERMWTDGYGGSLHTELTVPTAPTVTNNDVNTDSTRFNMSTGEKMAHMVYPPRIFDFNGLYGENAKPLVLFVNGWDEMDELTANDANLMRQYIDEGFGTIMLFNFIYTNYATPEPWYKDNNIYGYNLVNPEKVSSFIRIAHSKGAKVLSYLFYPSCSRWQGQNPTVTVKWMKRFQEDYHFDGWYLDTANAGELIEDYNFIRQVRNDVGDNGVIYHNSIYVWGNVQSGLPCIMIDAYINNTLTGENGISDLINAPTDAYFRFYTSGYGMSQAYGSHLRNTENTPATSYYEIGRILGENLNCAQRDVMSYPAFFEGFSAAYEARRQEYQKYMRGEPNNFQPDVKWPIGSDGWFRTPCDINVVNITENTATVTWTTKLFSDSKVSYTREDAWWADSYSDTPDPNCVVCYDSNMVESHSLTLANLTSNTNYKFRIRSSNQADPNEILWGYVGTFTTYDAPVSHWWKLDNVNGTTAIDSVDSNSNGTFSGNKPNWTSRKYNGAVDFNGGSDYFSVSNLDNQYQAYNDSNFSVSGWFKTSQTSGIQTIVGNWNQYSFSPFAGLNITFYFGWQVLVQNNKVVARFGFSSSTSDITGDSNVTDGRWHHFALVYPNGVSNSILYVDGNRQGTPKTVTGLLSDTKFRIGDGSYVSEGNPPLKGGPFKGTINDVRIYNTALSAAGVQKIYSE